MTLNEKYEMLLDRKDGMSYIEMAKKYNTTEKGITQFIYRCRHNYKMGDRHMVKGIAEKNRVEVKQVIELVKHEVRRETKIKNALIIKIKEFISNSKLWYKNKKGQLYRVIQQTATHYYVSAILKVRIEDAEIV